MTPFQIISLSLLAYLFLCEMARIRRGGALHGGKWIRALVWLCAGIAIAWPAAVQAIAEGVGINRGADLVFYLFVLVFLGTAFYFYSRLIQTRRQITQLVRHLSIQEAQRGAILAEIGQGGDACEQDRSVHIAAD